jgi:hypothetical protein
MKMREPTEAGAYPVFVSGRAALRKTGRIEIFQHEHDFVTMRLERQARRNAAIGIAMPAPLAVPDGLDLIGAHFAPVRQVVLRTAALPRQFDIFDDHAGSVAAGQAVTYNLAIAAPEALHNLKLNGGLSTGRFEDESLNTGIHHHSKSKLIARIAHLHAEGYSPNH